MKERRHALEPHRRNEPTPRDGARLEHRVRLVPPELVVAQIEGEERDRKAREEPDRGPLHAPLHRTPRTSTSLSAMWLRCTSRTYRASMPPTSTRQGTICVTRV